jgi:hypothetical protein
MASSLVFLTPNAALVALGALLPLGALYIVRRRARRVRGVLGLAEPSARRAIVAVIAVVAAGAFLGVAAAQPVVERTLTARVRTDSEAFVVVDVSRSMLGQESQGSPMRIERAKQFAVALRASLPEIPFGVASMTDRVLPHLLPSVNQAVFQATVQRSIGIEKPPPRSSVFLSATRLDALGTIRTQRFFSPRARKRLVVVLTDGESQPVALERLRSLFLQSPPIATVFVHFWDRDERVFTGNAPEAGYRPDPSARELLENLAAAVQGRIYDEEELNAVRSYARDRLGSGPTVVQGERGSRIALAPYFAAAALAPLVLLLWRRDR